MVNLFMGSITLKVRETLAYKDDFMVGDHDLYQTFKRVTELGATVLVHAENGNMIDFVSSLCVSRCR